MKLILPPVIFISVALSCVFGETTARSTEANVIKLPKSNLTVALPKWEAITVKTPQGFITTAFPLRPNPIIGLHYGLILEVTEYPSELHALAFPKKTENEKNINRRYAEATIIEVEEEIFVVRDVVCSPKIVVRFVGTIRKGMPDKLKRLDELRAVIAAPYQYEASQ